MTVTTRRSRRRRPDVKLARAPISQPLRFAILSRDEFTCLFCGGRPGNDLLEIDHLLPHSAGGSDDEENLATTCARCNRGKGDVIAIPKSLCDGFIDRQGWHTWKRWGDWHLQFRPGARHRKRDVIDMLDSPLVDTAAACALTFDPSGRDYFIAIDRVHESGWEDHLAWKPWLSDDRAPRRNGPYPGKGYDDFLEAVTFARRIVRVEVAE